MAEMEESPYCASLDAITRGRYLQKVSKYAGRDPYLLKKADFSTNLKDLPAIEAIDISNYLVLQTFFYTRQQMKAYKSMEAYNYFVCGWVRELGSKILKNHLRLVFARVNHSQRSGETPLKTWIIAQGDGEVVAAHCNCMAGLSESCSHVGALLFAIEAGCKIRDSASCTTEKCQWLMPSHVKKCPHNLQDEISLRQCAGDKGFCLIKDGDDVTLDQSHAYYHQVQAQLHIVDAEYCDFVVWNRNDIVVERIVPDQEFWEEVTPKVENFFRNCILPEVLGHHVTKTDVDM